MQEFLGRGRRENTESTNRVLEGWGLIGRALDSEMLRNGEKEEKHRGYNVHGVREMILTGTEGGLLTTTRSRSTETTWTSGRMRTGTSCLRRGRGGATQNIDSFCI